jgi:hypothetical protein
MAIVNKIFTNCLNSSDTQSFQYNDIVFTPSNVISVNGVCYQDTLVNSNLIATQNITSSGFTSCEECLTTTMTGLVVSSCTGSSMVYITIPNSETPLIGETIQYNSICWVVVSATTEFYNIQSSIPSFVDCVSCASFGSTVRAAGGPKTPGDPGVYTPTWRTEKFSNCCNSSEQIWVEIDINPTAWGASGSQVWLDPSLTNPKVWLRMGIVGTGQVANGMVLLPGGQSCNTFVTLCPTLTPTPTPTPTLPIYQYYGNTILIDGTTPLFNEACGGWLYQKSYYGSKPLNLLAVNDYLYTSSSRGQSDVVQGSNIAVLPLASNSSGNDIRYFQVRSTGRIDSIVTCTSLTWYTYVSPNQYTSPSVWSFADRDDACDYSYNQFWVFVYGLKPIDQLIPGDRLYNTQSTSDPRTGIGSGSLEYQPMYAWDVTNQVITGDKYLVEYAGAANGFIDTIDTCDNIFPPTTPTPTPTPTGCPFPLVKFDCYSYTIQAIGNTDTIFEYERCTVSGIDNNYQVTVTAFSSLSVCSQNTPVRISGGPGLVSPQGGFCLAVCINTTPTPTPSPTTTPSPTNTTTPTNTPTVTETPTNTPTTTETPTNTPTNTQTPTQTVTQGLTPTSTPSNTPTPTITSTNTPTTSETPTPTTSSTPTQTPTNTNTPSSSPIATTTTTRPSMVNECGVVTVQPMGVTCTVINPTTIGGLGTAILNVTGGTGPYMYLWEDGSTQSFITNLAGGTYEVTVSDYFGDYVVKTFCVVSSAPTVTQTPTPSSTVPLSTSTPTPTPSSTPIPILCGLFSLTNSSGVIINEQYEFYYNTTISNANSWTATTSANYLTNNGYLLLSYNKFNAVWTISQIVNSNNIIWSFQITNPSGGNTIPLTPWVLNGNTTYIDSFGRTNTLNSVQMTLGICSVVSLNATIITQSATCSQVSDGSVTITANGGTPIYTYSLDNINYTPNNTFTNLPSGFYTVYVKDSGVTPQIFSQSISIVTTYSQPQPTTLSFIRTQFVVGSNNNQPTIIDEFSQYELNLNGLSSGVSLSTFNLNLQIENITKEPGTTNANGTTVTVSVNNLIVFTTGITPSTLWTETTSQPRGNVACPNELTTSKKILVPDRFGTSLPIRIVPFLNRNLVSTDTIVVTVLNKAQITNASPQISCPTELTNTIILSSTYATAGPSQVCFPVVGNPSINETAFRSASQVTSITYTGNWRIQVAGTATCVEITSVKTSTMGGSSSLRFDCNNQSGSVPNPFTSPSVSAGQTSIVSPPNAVSCGNLIPWVNPETFTINYFVTSPCTQCSGDYELSLSVNNTGVVVSQTISMTPGNGFVTFSNIVINSNSLVTIRIDCII